MCIVATSNDTVKYKVALVVTFLTVHNILLSLTDFIPNRALIV